MIADPRLAELVELLAAARRELAGALERVPVERRDRAPADGAWSAAQVVEHLALVESRSIAAFEQAAGHAPPRAADDALPDDAPPYDVAPILDRTTRVTAPEPVQPAAHATAAEAWARLGLVRERTEAVLQAADGRALERVELRHPRFGPLDGYRFLAVLAAHERRHAAQVREIADALAPRTRS